MFPIFFHIGSIPIYSYGVLGAVGFLAGLSVLRREARHEGWPVERVTDWAFMSLVLGFLGARVLFVLTQAEYFFKNPGASLLIWQGGFVFYGGLIAVLPYGLWFAKKNRLDLLKFTDAVTLSTALGHAISRIGCFTTGCCFGTPTDLPWGFVITSESVPEIWRGQHLHPTPLYETLGLLGLFVLLLRMKRHRKYSGQIALGYFAGYPLLRFFLEFLRGDPARGELPFPIFGIEISTSQFISLIFFLASLWLYFYLHRRVSKTNKEATLGPPRP